MTPLQFWHCTPRKFYALCKVHAEINDPKEKDKNKKEEPVFVDQLSFM